MNRMAVFQPEPRPVYYIEFLDAFKLMVGNEEARL